MRIVSLLPSATEILFAVGAGEHVVGVTHECDQPAAATTLPRLTSNAIDHDGALCAEIDRHVKRALHEGSSIYRLDTALLARLRPDLIVTQELCEVCAVSYRDVARAVRTIASDATVISLEPASLDDVLTTIGTVGDCTGCGAQAADLVARMRSRLDAVAGTRARSSRPTVACIEWTDPLMVAGHWVPEMVEIAGGSDMLGLPGEPSRWISPADVIEASPDILILMPCGFGLDDTTCIGERLLRDDPQWLGGSAIVAVDGSSFFNRPGPRVVDGVELLAEIFSGDVRAASTQARWLRLPRRPC